MIGRGQIKFLLLMIAINVVVSCLVTNCPRGGKRGLSQPSESNLVSSGLKKCKICSASREICLGVFCWSDISCGDEGQCVALEVCCSKRLCKFHKSCKPDFDVQNYKQITPTSIILTKILNFNLNHSNDMYREEEK